MVWVFYSAVDPILDYASEVWRYKYCIQIDAVIRDMGWTSSYVGCN